MVPSWQRTSAQTVARAREILQEHRRSLQRIGVPGCLELTGGSSVEGLLTKGDIDLHLRLRPGEFRVALDLLPQLYERAKPEIWTDSFAVFELASDPPVGVAVTVLDSEHDRRFTSCWLQMRIDADARRRYNHLKASGGDVESAKSRFFDELAGRIEG